MSFRSLKEKLFPGTFGDDMIDDEYAEAPDDVINEPEARPAYAPARPAPLAPRTGSAVEMKVVSPTSYDAAPSIANLLCDGVTVLLNLEKTNKEVSRRLIDFLSGAAYALSGDVKRVAENTFAITPKNVNVSNDVAETPAPAAEAPVEDGEAY